MLVGDQQMEGGSHATMGTAHDWYGEGLLGLVVGGSR